MNKLIFIVVAFFIANFDFNLASRPASFRIAKIFRSDDLPKDNASLETHYSDDDNGYVYLKEINLTVFHSRCRNCHSKNKDCEHQPIDGKHEVFAFPLYAEKFFRKKSLVKVNGSTCIQIFNDPEQQMLQHFMGTQDVNDSCNPTPNKKQMCKNFHDAPHIKNCFLLTNLSCNKATKKCQQIPLGIERQWNITHFDTSNGCLNDVGKQFYETALKKFGGSQNGMKLHHESCEPFDDDSPNDRCMIVSKEAVDYSSTQKPRSTCWKPTYLRCHPIFKKCICDGGGPNNHEIEFQFGNKSKICFLRPTMNWRPGFSCGGRSKAVRLFNGKRICQCNSTTHFLPLFNSQCKHWWICGGAQIYPNVIAIIVLLFLTFYYRT